MCKRWRNSFSAFLEDMGLRPSPLHTIERIDNDGHYEPLNCIWILSAQQASNKRTTVRVSYKGKVMTLVQAAEAEGVRYKTAWAQMRRGVTFARVEERA